MRNLWKGNATVIMDQADYKKKIEDLLEDPVYRKISKDQTSATDMRRVCKRYNIRTKTHWRISQEFCIRSLAVSVMYVQGR